MKHPVTFEAEMFTDPGRENNIIISEEKGRCFESKFEFLNIKKRLL